MTNYKMVSNPASDLANRFTYHPPTPEQPEVYRLIRDYGLALAALVEVTAPPSREASLAVTKVEEAVMWANAAIARHGLAPTADDANSRDLSLYNASRVYREVRTEDPATPFDGMRRIEPSGPDV